MVMNPFKCRSCGEVNPKEAAFCRRCGRFLRPLNDQYYIVEDIAKGGLSTIYKAEDIDCFNQIVAIKKFTPKSEKPEARHQARVDCEREAEILSKLNHHSIPTVHTYFSSDHNWFLVMSFVEGETLESRWQRAKRSNRLSVEEIINIGIELCNVLQYLHSPENSIVFRDLKPSNIILDKNRHLYLVDFGSAHYLKSAQAGEPGDLGTQGYAAPELLRKQSSFRSDIYSLGAILFQLVSGKRYTGNATYSDRSGIEDRINTHTPSQLLELISQMMKEDEDERPTSAAEVKKALQEIAHQLAAPDESSEKANTGRRNFILGGLIGTAGVAIGGAAVLWTALKPPVAIPAPKVIQFPLTIAGKLDDEAVLLTEMYVLLLQNAGFSINAKPRLGTNDIVFDAIKTGAIDIYPEFLLTGLQRLGIATAHSQALDFQNVQQGFRSSYQIVWLDQVLHLDDNYCVTLPREQATQLGVKTLSEFAAIIKNQSLNLTVAFPPDGQTLAIPSLQMVYGFTFNTNNMLSMDEKQTFAAVQQNAAQFNICIATDPLIAKDNFVRLTDDKGAFPVDTPSPIVREEVLRREPIIATILNKLAPRLSVDVSTQLQAQMLQGKPAMDVAKDWLVSQKLLEQR